MSRIAIEWLVILFIKLRMLKTWGNYLSLPRSIKKDTQ